MSSIGSVPHSPPSRATRCGGGFIAGVLLQACGGFAWGAGESSPVEVFRPSTTLNWNNEWFSVGLDLGPSRLVVGSYQKSASYPGMVHVYRRAAGAWELEQVVPHLQNFDHADFGDDVALSDDERTLFIGAPLDGPSNLGAVYLYRHTEGLGWMPAGKLVAPDGVELDHFGGALDVSGDHLAVAAYRTNDAAFDSGSIYLFARQANDTWIQTQRIQLADGAESDLFGNQLHIEGDLLVVSSVTRDIGGFADQGFVQTYQRDPATGRWVDLGRLTAHDGSPNDYFGSALAISENRLAVGARGRGVPKPGGIAAGQGSVYVYERDPQQPSGWRFVTLVKSDDGAAGDWFGRSVDFDGELLVVGAPLKKNALGTQIGAAYVFLQNGGGIANQWRQVHKLNYGGTSSFTWFGDAVAISGTDLFVGARRDSQISSNQGSLWRFNRAFDQSVPTRDHDDWLKSHFTADELLVPALRHTLWGGAADPDGDSLSNAAEYFAGTHPRVADPFAARPKAVFSGSQLVWSHARAIDPARNGVAYLQSGNHLWNWRRRSETIVANSETLQTLTLPNYRANGSRQFFRLAYELP